MKSQPIPILDLRAQYAAIKNEIQAAINQVLDKQQFILGEEVEALEASLAAYCNCRYAIGVSSGTDALMVSLMAIGIKPGDEVITTPYSFFATAGSVVRLGGKPVFVDIDPGTLNIQVDQIEKVVTKRTKAIIPVHLAGQMADMEPLMDIARRYGLSVIEDACQAIGADYRGLPAGSIGHFGCFSFFPSKNLGGYGDSGLVTTNDPVLAEKVRLLRNHGQKPKYHNLIVGGNFRMDAIQAAILRVKFNHLEGWTETRRRHAKKYRELFSRNDISIPFDHFETDTGIVLPVEAGFGRHIYHLFIIRTKSRDEMLSCLRQNGIGCEIYYPLPLHLQECFHDLGNSRGDFPYSEKASKETLAIPIYPELTDDMISYVVDKILEFFRTRFS